MEKPRIKTEGIDFTALQKICQEYIDFVDDDEKYYEDNDYDYLIFEAAMETMFGKKVWSFINNRRE